jgi:hypothetical protein
MPSFIIRGGIPRLPHASYWCNAWLSTEYVFMACYFILPLLCLCQFPALSQVILWDISAGDVSHCRMKCCVIWPPKAWPVSRYQAQKCLEELRFRHRPHHRNYMLDVLIMMMILIAIILQSIGKLVWWSCPLICIHVKMEEIQIYKWILIVYICWKPCNQSSEVCHMLLNPGVIKQVRVTVK